MSGEGLKLSVVLALAGSWYVHDAGTYMYIHTRAIMIPTLQAEGGERDEGETSSLSDSTVERNLSQFQINHKLAPSYLPPRVLDKVECVYECCICIHFTMYSCLLVCSTVHMIIHVLYVCCLQD